MYSQIWDQHILTDLCIELHRTLRKALQVSSDNISASTDQEPNINGARCFLNGPGLSKNIRPKFFIFTSNVAFYSKIGHYITVEPV